MNSSTDVEYQKIKGIKWQNCKKDSILIVFSEKKYFMLFYFLLKKSF